MVMKARGERTITLSGVEYPLLPTFGCISKIEGMLNKSITRVVRDITAAEIGLHELAVVISEANKAAGGKLTPQDAGRKILKDGLFLVIPRLQDFVLVILNGMALNKDKDESESEEEGEESGTSEDGEAEPKK